MSITNQIIEEIRRTPRLTKKPPPVKESPPNCLLVEDNPNDIELAWRALTKIGVNVTVASTGDKAIAILNQSKDPLRPDFDIVFLDLVLTGSMSQGIHVLEHIREHFPSIHVVLVSGHVDENVLTLINSYQGKGGYVGVVTKPLEPMDVKEILEKHHFLQHEQKE